MFAEELMTPDPSTIGPEESVHDALALLHQLHARHLPVVERGVLIGMISDRDLRDVTLPFTESLDQAAVARDQLARPVRDVMQSDLLAVGLQDDVDEVIELLVEHKVGAVPVVVDGTRELAGIISYIDVLRICQGTL